MARLLAAFKRFFGWREAAPHWIAEPEPEMTERQWLACVTASRMLRHLRGRASDRKFRLFAVTCYRRVGEEAAVVRLVSLP
jgi:hypothetical protein